MIKKMRGRIVYIINKNHVLLYKSFSFFLVDINKNESTYIAAIPHNNLKEILSKVRVLNRLLRMEPRCVEKLSDNIYIIGFAHAIWLLNIKNKSFTKLAKSRLGWSNPLNFCTDDCGNVYWGDYGNNPERDEVYIYKLDKELKLDVIYSFPINSIRHIHNVIFDSFKQCFWIFTGDNEEKSGIYIADKEWKNIVPIQVGKQIYRTVIGFPYKDGIIYATDSVDKKNNIIVLSKNNNYEPKIIASINGSCINGTETKDYYIFSTTVEPQEGRGFLNMFSYKLGKGILNRDVHVISVNKKNLSVSVMLKYHKDIYPMKLFQYGMVLFPKGQKNMSTLVIYPLACKKVDGKNLTINL